MSYVEFIRGKYKPSDPLYIRSLLRGMTYYEHERILTRTFQELWTEMWVTKNVITHRQEYEKSRRRFVECIDDVRRYIPSIKSPKEEPEWTFPKGRPQSGESDRACAIREFEEETGMSREHIHILSEHPYRELYTGTNGIVYENHLYLASTIIQQVGVDSSNEIQCAEVSDVKWISPEEANEKMRQTYPSREVILQDAIHQFLMKT